MSEPIKHSSERSMGLGVVLATVAATLVMVTAGAFALGRTSAPQTTAPTGYSQIMGNHGPMWTWVRHHDNAWTRAHLGDLMWIRHHRGQWTWVRGHMSQVGWMRDQLRDLAWMRTSLLLDALDTALVDHPSRSTRSHRPAGVGSRPPARLDLDAAPDAPHDARRLEPKRAPQRVELAALTAAAS